MINSRGFGSANRVTKASIPMRTDDCERSNWARIVCIGKKLLRQPQSGYKRRVRSRCRDPWGRCSAPRDLDARAARSNEPRKQPHVKRFVPILSLDEAFVATIVAVYYCRFVSNRSARPLYSPLRMQLLLRLALPRARPARAFSLSALVWSSARFLGDSPDAARR